MMPFVRRNIYNICEEDVSAPPARQEEDAYWIRRGMARRIGVGAELLEDPRDSSDSRGLGVPPDACKSANVFREAPAYITAPYHAVRDVYAAERSEMPKTPTNKGVATRRNPIDRRLKRGNSRHRDTGVTEAYQEDRGKESNR